MPVVLRLRAAKVDVLRIKHNDEGGSVKPIYGVLRRF